ncbi:MAG TPA: sulfotransferase family 2 domain-containing protein, partial [bacterium]|nr:sulfotransferase family 2 domain-containing protein [bacterium]
RVGADLRWRDAHLARFAGFEEFVLTGLRRREVQDWLHFVPQWDFLSVPWSSKPQVDFIGHFETMEQDFAAVAARLGLAASLEVRNSTKSRDRDYRRYYTAASRRVVESVYARDIRALGYEF